MDRSAYEQFTQTIVQHLENDDRVLGLVAAGSTASGFTASDNTATRQPDQWSDHDFWIITTPGAENDFRLGEFWLPEPERIVLNFQETEHARNILYDDGHLIEVAVVDLAELHVARLNAYRVMLDKTDITAQLARQKEATDQWVVQQRPTDEYLIGKFLTNLLVGFSRYRRGEVISVTTFVKTHALGHLIPLLVCYGADFEDSQPNLTQLDNLDPLRCFEFAFPNLGTTIQASLIQDIPAAASGLLSLAERVLSEQLPDYPAAAVNMLQAVINKPSESDE